MNNPYFDRPAMNVNSIYEAIADLKESITILNDLVIGDDFFYFYNGTSDDIVINVTDSVVESPNDSDKAVFDNGTIKLNMWRTNNGSRVGIIPAKGTIIFYDEFGQEITRQDLVKEEGDETKYAETYVPEGTKSFEIFNAISKRTYKVSII